MGSAVVATFGNEKQPSESFSQKGHGGLRKSRIREKPCFRLSNIVSGNMSQYQISPTQHALQKTKTSPSLALSLSLSPLPLSFTLSLCYAHTQMDHKIIDLKPMSDNTELKTADGEKNRENEREGERERQRKRPKKQSLI